MPAFRKHNQISPELGPTQLIAVSSLSFPRSFRNYKTSTIRQAARFIETFGIRLPVLVDAERNVIAGEIWALAVKSLEMPEIPVLFAEGLSADQLSAYRIGIQRIPELAAWDDLALGEIFKEWTSRTTEFDIEIAGFSMPEIDTLVGNFESAALDGETEEDQNPLDSGVAVTRSGDLWTAGDHRVLCGSSLDDSSFASLMSEEKASIVMTDPPYNVAIDGHAGGKGSIHHREFAMASGEMKSAEFANFLETSMSSLAKFSLDGSLHYLFMDWRHAGEMLAAGRKVYSELKNIIVWVKSNAGMGSLYRSQHELVFLFKKGSAGHRNNVQLGRHGRNRTNVWNYAGATSLDGRKTDEGHLLELHPTVKPVQILVDAILDSSARGDIVLDCFLGSGSTLLAAERVGRKLFGIEFDPLYVDVTIRRWQRQTGQQAINSATGCSFDEAAEVADQTNPPFTKA
jgi:DNA modification methylase